MKELLNALEIIQNTCNENITMTDECYGCPLRNMDNECAITDKKPYKWVVNRSEWRALKP